LIIITAININFIKQLENANSSVLVEAI